jgi:hypothetical protein
MATEDDGTNVVVKLSQDAMLVLKMYQTAHNYDKRDLALDALLKEQAVRDFIADTAQTALQKHNRKEKPKAD